MSNLTLHVDAERWRHHISHYVARHQGDLVPVIKGNGYGFGIPTLAREASTFKAECVACYNADEAAAIRSQFDGDVLLLAPDEVLDEKWVIHTISPISENFAASNPKRFVVELLSPVKRHGYQISAIAEALTRYSATGVCEGLAIHLPINQKRSTLQWIEDQLGALTNFGVTSAQYRNTIWISHISADDLLSLKKSWPEIRWRVRVGTDLWLGARTSLTATATVKDRHRISPNERVGYRQSAPGAGWLIVAAGGTSHGIGLEVPSGGVKSLIKSLLRFGGWQPSPYSWEGKSIQFAEAPHMHNSLLYLKSAKAPEIGEEIGLNVRFTTTTFDEVIFE